MKVLRLLKATGFYAVLSLIISLTLTACDKDDDEPSREEIVEQLIAGSDSKTWLIVSSTISGTETLSDCVKDDHWTFKRTRQVSRQNQSNTCTDGFPDKENSNWNIENDGKWLTFFDGTYEILSLTETEMKLQFPTARGTYIDTFVSK
ncbi:lipocalin family protein [Chryseolinea sp. T2]|uniref:lipocalin family protein n=1 Tax=Chryseolinea sp. T2 TaxID=3129255 RepID=UPI003077CEDC